MKALDWWVEKVICLPWVVTVFCGKCGNTCPASENRQISWNCSFGNDLIEPQGKTSILCWVILCIYKCLFIDHCLLKKIPSLRGKVQKFKDQWSKIKIKGQWGLEYNSKPGNDPVYKTSLRKYGRSKYRYICNLLYMPVYQYGFFSPDTRVQKLRQTNHSLKHPQKMSK